MSKKNLIYSIVFLATVLAIVTRLYQLGTAPKGLYLDEAGQGYNSYSILKTGKDEFGKLFPIVFRSFTDFKTPVYIYLIVPLIPIFGLTAFTVRFPSFFFSILTVPLIYLLIKEITPKSKGSTLAILGSLLLAISPWHILFGRTNFECNVALFFFLFGVYLFYKALKKPKLLILSLVTFAIAIPTYHSQRLITPLIVLVLFLRHKRKLLSKTHIKPLLIGAVFALIISLPTLSVAATPGFLARAAGLNIFNYSKTLPSGYLHDFIGPWNWLINNPIFLSSKEFLSLYSSYLLPRNMFVLGDYDPRSSFPELATFFLWQSPFYLIGLYHLAKNKKLGEIRFLTLALLLIGPLPAAVTRDPYSSIRALQMVIPQTIASAFGLIIVYQYLKTKAYDILPALQAVFPVRPWRTKPPKEDGPFDKLRVILSLSKDDISAFNSSMGFTRGFLECCCKGILVSAFILLIIYSLAKLYSSVIILNEYYRAKYWNYGWEQVVETIETLDPSLPVVIDTARDIPYIQILFYLKFDPATYQKENFEVPLKEYYTNMKKVDVKKIGNIVTRIIDWKSDVQKEQYIVGDSLAISDQQIEEHKLTLIGEVYYPDGRVAFKIVKTNPELKRKSEFQLKDP